MNLEWNNSEEFYDSACEWYEAGKPMPLSIWLGIRDIPYRLTSFRISEGKPPTKVKEHYAHVWGEVQRYDLDPPKPRNRKRAVKRPTDGSQDKVFIFPRRIAN